MTQRDSNAKLTEEPNRPEHVLVDTFPAAAVWDPIPRALFHDARTNHLRSLFADFDALYKAWLGYSADCQAWANKVASWILEGGGLETFPPKVPYAPYVMHTGLAAFLYQRLFGFDCGVLRKVESSTSTAWQLVGGAYTFAVGTEAQIVALLDKLESFRESERDIANGLRTRSAALHARYRGFLAALDAAIAAKKLHGRCDLVPFL